MLCSIGMLGNQVSLTNFYSPSPCRRNNMSILNTKAVVTYKHIDVFVLVTPLVVLCEDHYETCLVHPCQYYYVYSGSLYMFLLFSFILHNQKYLQ